jgi:hypothetical protein
MKRSARRARRHGVVATHEDLAIVQQHGVGDAAEAAQRLGVVDDQRLPARIGRGADQCEWLWLLEPGHARGPARGLVEQQVVQRRVGQHHAEQGEARRDPGRLVGSRVVLLEQHDRPLRRLERSLLGRAQPRVQPRRGDIRHQQREGLFLARLAFAQSLHAVRVTGIADQVKATEPLDGEDLPGTDQRQRIGDGIGGGQQAAVRAAHRLSDGPQSGQAFGWAWKRRCRGSRYSPRQGGHWLNAAMLVLGRS